MAQTFRSIHAGPLAALMRNVALSIALIVLATPAHAEIVTLICNNEQPGGGSFTLRVDYDRKIVDWLRADGTVMNTATAKVTESAVEWWPNPDSDSKTFWGQINRLSGVGGIGWVDQWRGDHHMSGPCRRATQKF